MLKRVLASMLVLAMSVGIFTGCANQAETGTDSSQASSQSSSETTESASDTTVSTEPVVISIMSWHGDGDGSKYYEGMKYVMDEYTKSHANVTFEYIQQPLDGYSDLLDTQFIAGTAADIIYMQPWMTSGFAEKGVLLPLDDYMYAESAYADGQRWVDTFSGGEDSFLTSKTSNSQGAIMFVPMDSSATLSMGQPFFYNKDLFAKAGITTLPETFAEFLACLKQLQDAGITPVAGEFTDRHVSWSLGWISDQFGEHYIDKYFDGKYNGSEFVQLKNDKNTIALATDMLKADDQILLDISNSLYDYSQFWQDGWTGASYTEAKNLFLMQEAAIFQEGFWAFTEYQDLITDFEWGVLPIPLVTSETSEFAMNGFTKATGQQDYGYDLNKALQDDPTKLAAVIDFMQFLTSKDIQQTYVDLAVSLSAVDGVEQPEAMQPFIFNTDLSIYEQPLGPSYVDYGDSGIWGGLAQQYLTNEIDVSTFNTNCLENSKLTAIEACREKLDTLPTNIDEAKTKLADLEAAAAADTLINAQKNTIALLELKLEMYKQYCSEI